MQPLRLTFREKVDVCYQKTLRDKYLSEGVPAVPHLDVGRAVVRPVSRKLAEQIILKYEWLGTMASTSIHYGAFFGLYCAGVTCVALNGVGAAGAYHFEQFGVARADFATLARGANVHWSPVGTNSKLVSWTCKHLSANKLAKLIIAYSDSEAGEIGTIYQACNWIYIGKTDGAKRQDSEMISPAGRAYNRRILGSIAHKNQTTITRVKAEMLSRGWSMQSGNPKHRYVFILDKYDKQLIQRVEAMRKPYPKRVSGEIDNALDSNQETGGASPTETLTFPSLPVTRHPAGG